MICIHGQKKKLKQTPSNFGGVEYRLSPAVNMHTYAGPDSKSSILFTPD